MRSGRAQARDLHGPRSCICGSLAEGRRSFLERYARIETGRECERLAPVLSAFVDGEGDAARPLTVVFPAAGLVVASGGAEQAHGFFVRVYETLSMHMHERTANSFVRAQAIVDMVTAGKMAAAAAALAGGGVTVAGVLSGAPATPEALVRRVDNGGATAFVKQPVQQHTKTHTHAKRPSHARASTLRRQRTTVTSAASASRGAATTPSSGASAPVATAPRATVASAGGAKGAGTSATSEFGFEGP